MGSINIFFYTDLGLPRVLQSDSGNSVQATACWPIFPISWLTHLIDTFKALEKLKIVSPLTRLLLEYVYTSVSLNEQNHVKHFFRKRFNEIYMDSFEKKTPQTGRI